MKNMKLFRAIGEVDSRYVEEAARPVRKMVWMPIVAAAACVALTVGLWQGGVFGSEKLPVEAPNESTTTEPTDTTADTTTTTTAKPTTTTTVKPTTTTTAKTTTKTTTPYILVGGEDEEDFDIDSFELSLKDRFVSPALEAKMKEYREVNAVYQVVVWSVFTSEDYHEFDKFLEADEEYQSLTKQYEEAKKAEKEASDRLHDAQVINANKNEPQIDVTPLEEEYRKAEKIYNELSEERSALHQELFEEFCASIKNERISHAARYSKTEPISGYGSYGNGYYMELTADAINELADRGGYSFKLTTEKKREDAKYEAVDA